MTSQLLEALVNRSDLRPKPPHPVSFFGAYIGSINFSNHCWEVKGAIRDCFADIILPEIRDYLQGFFGSIPSEDRITFSVYMVGKSLSSAAPTVVFISENATYRKSARKAIKESGIISQYAGFKTAHIAKDPGFQRMEQLATSDKATAVASSDERSIEVFYNSTRPFRTLGMPIFIRHGTSFRAGTANAIHLGEYVYLQTVYHAFTWRHVQSQKPPALDDDFEIDSDTDSAADLDDEPNAAITSIGSRSPDTCSQRGSDCGSLRHSTTFSGRSTPMYDVPAQSDNRFNTSIMDQATSRLASFTTGHPSITPRQTFQIPTENLHVLGKLFKWSNDKDWAIVQVTDPEAQKLLKQVSLQDGLQALAFNNIASRLADETQVTAHTITGQITGFLSGTPSYTQQPQSASF